MFRVLDTDELNGLRGPHNGRRAKPRRYRLSRDWWATCWKQARREGHVTLASQYYCDAISVGRWTGGRCMFLSGGGLLLWKCKNWTLAASYWKGHLSRDTSSMFGGTSCFWKRSGAHAWLNYCCTIITWLYKIGLVPKKRKKYNRKAQKIFFFQVLDQQKFSIRDKISATMLT